MARKGSWGGKVRQNTHSGILAKSILAKGLPSVQPLQPLSCPSSSRQFLTGHYWALFDGHGGPDAAIIASNYLHYCIKQKLEEIVGGITEAQPPMHLSGRCVCDSDPQFVEEKHIHAADLVVGALENAFQECVSTPCRAPATVCPSLSPGRAGSAVLLLAE